MEQEKKSCRKRKKQLYNTIREQMEFYFSDSNLVKDKFLSKLLNDAPDAFIELETFTKFNKIRSLTTNVSEIVKALSTSEILQVNSEKNKVRRITPVQKCENIDECTIYVENFPQTADHTWLKNYFSSFGNVTYVSLPKFKAVGQNKGFAFIEFSNVDAAKRACEHFKPTDNVYNDILLEPSIKKGRLMDEDDVTCNPSISTLRQTASEQQHYLSHNENQDQKTDTAQEKKKKKRKKRKKSKDEQTDGFNLYVISKTQWKTMRNKYLALQKSNMTQLKRSLGLLKSKITSPKWEEQPPAPIIKTEFSPGLIVKLTSTKSVTNVKDFKMSVQKEAKVEYIDVSNDQRNIFIRCSTPADSSILLKSKYITQYGPPILLDGDEEKCYWEKLQADRLAKHQIKSRPKIGGRQRIVLRAEKLLNGPKHIHFDD